MQTIMKQLEELKKALTKKEVTSRFLTIGFTAEHDAAFLNRIAQAGTDLGNFFYVDTSQSSYPEQIKDALQSSLSMAQEEDGLQITLTGADGFKETVLLPKALVGDDEDEDESAADKSKPEQVGDLIYDFTLQSLIKESAIDSLSGKLFLSQSKSHVPVTLEKTLVENPSPQALAVAQVRLINRLIFDTIQEIQQAKRPRTNQEVYEYVKSLDQELDAHGELAFKVKDRDARKDILLEIQQCKEKTFNTLEVLRGTQGKIPNAQIAKLNDLAYKAVRKRGNQKKLDERAIKNDAFYKKINKQLKECVKQFDMGALKTQHTALAEVVGNCPLSCNDLFEAIEMGDCMCVGLDVSRSEACIADPTRLVIRDIIPTFMTADSFLDSAVFSLRKNEEAHGGFGGASAADKASGLAQGLGREKITGVMPLYLFKEHWEIARRKSPPIYGFLCTLDIMGYASSQYFTVPFLVLLKALEKAKEEPTQINVAVRDMVLQTCKIIFMGNEEFRKNTIKMIVDFYQGAEYRTADIVPSIPLLIAQLYTLLQCDNYSQYLLDVIPLNAEQLRVIFRYAFEEQLRRAIKNDAEPLSKGTILKALFPQYADWVKALMEKRGEEIKADFKKGGGGSAGHDEAMAPYKVQADLFRMMDGVAAGKQGASSADTTAAKEDAKDDQVTTSTDKQEKTDVYAIAEKYIAE